MNWQSVSSAQNCLCFFFNFSPALYDSDSSSEIFGKGPFNSHLFIIYFIFQTTISRQICFVTLSHSSVDYVGSWDTDCFDYFHYHILRQRKGRKSTHQICHLYNMVLCWQHQATGWAHRYNGKKIPRGIECISTFWILTRRNEVSYTFKPQ